jgi:PAS domain S-box-containing protein
LQPDNPIVYVSDAFTRQTGYDLDDAMGRNCRFLQGPGTDPEAVASIRGALEARRSITVDILNYRKDGSPFWNRLRIRPVFDRDGRLHFDVGCQNPIPAHQARRRALVEPLMP